MADGFNISELTNFEKNLMSLANDKMPKDSRKFLKNEGNKLKKKTASLAKSSIISDSEVYAKSIKRGKVYKYRGNSGLATRVYSSAPHAHLLEYGHRQVQNPGKGEGNGRGVKPGRGIGKEIGFIPGFRIFEKAERGFANEHYSNVQRFLDDVLDKGL